ncbi:proline--tRNA ligase [bacterium]|nr:proline--tRNA ligase [bacterium]
MLASKIIKTSKTSPKASTVHETLLLQGGFVQKLGAGIYQFLPLGFLVYKKIYRIIEEELSKIGFLPFLAPMVQPSSIWKKSGRWEDFGAELLRFKNRSQEEFVLAPTHEENVSLVARQLIKSFRDLPLALNQIQPKFRDEPRARGGLIRLREFTMQDGYSFHRDKKDLDTFYEEVKKAYLRIFERVGLKVRVVSSASGAMGGTKAEEFIVESEVGEDRIAVCKKCKYAANLEVARFKDRLIKEKPKKLKRVSTPKASTIEELSGFLKVDPHRLAKIVFFKNERGDLIVACVLGDREINERKLGLVTDSESLLSADENKIREFGYEPGFASPIPHTKAVIVIDTEVWKSNNLVTGDNERDFHLLNFNPARDIKHKKVKIADIAEVKEGDRCQCGGSLKVKRGIEVGNIFQLGDKYCRSFMVQFTDEKGKQHFPLEGCYGIGLERLMATIVEKYHDKQGIIWPKETAPFDIYLIYLGGDKEKKTAKVIYSELSSLGKDVLLDDRENSPGEKFADADLIGIPYRVIISSKTLSQGKVEVKERSATKKELVDLKTLKDYFQDK